MIIEIIDDSHYLTEKMNHLIEQAIDLALLEISFPYDVGLIVTICSNETIRQINHEQRQINKVTDVLSFPTLAYEGYCLYPEMADYSIIDPEDGRIFLGDIFLCYQRAVEQSQAYGHSVEREVVFLVIHSLLHLLGFDHVEPEWERLMIKWQKRLMEKIGLSR